MSLTVDSTCNPIKVTGTTDTSTSITTKQTYIKFIQWYQPTAQGHLLSVKDVEGNIITPAYCETANESQWIPIFGVFKGITIDNMDSGSVYIYIR